MKFFENLLKDGNTINESNIVVLVSIVLLIADEILAHFSSLTWIDIALIGICMLFIFLICKTEHSRLDANKVVKATAEVLKNK